MVVEYKSQAPLSPCIPYCGTYLERIAGLEERFAIKCLRKPEYPFACCEIVFCPRNNKSYASVNFAQIAVFLLYLDTRLCRQNILVVKTQSYGKTKGGLRLPLALFKSGSLRQILPHCRVVVAYTYASNMRIGVKNDSPLLITTIEPFVGKGIEVAYQILTIVVILEI